MRRYQTGVLIIRPVTVVEPGLVCGLFYEPIVHDPHTMLHSHEFPTLFRSNLAAIGDAIYGNNAEKCLSDPLTPCGQH